MLTLKQIKAEIYNQLKVYHQQGLLDDISIENGIKENILEFGGNIMEDYQQSIKVVRGKAKLPLNFYAMRAAVKCTPSEYKETEIEKHAQRKISYLEYTDINDYFNWLEGKPCKENGDTSYITETLYFEVPKKAYKIHYNQPEQLRLIPHVNKMQCDSDCPNLTSNSHLEISIDDSGKYISANFNKGTIWLWYRGLPCDESGDLIIPSTSRDKLKNYIVYFAIVRALESLWLSEDDPNIQNKLQFFQARANEYYYLAKQESMSKGSVGWKSRLVNNNRRRMNKYEVLMPNI